MHAIDPRDRKAAIVLAAIKGEALSRRPGGRPRLPLRATAVAKVVGTEEWCCVRSNRGMADSWVRVLTITPPWSIQAVPCRRETGEGQAQSKGRPVSLPIASS